MENSNKKSSTQAPPAQTQTQAQPAQVQRLPSEITLQNVCKLSITHDKPIMLDYWMDSIERKAIIGVKEASNEKMLVKSSEEYTSPISNLYRSGSEFIVVTENSIYLVSNDIPTRKIT
jgi:hypothetical protein